MRKRTVPTSERPLLLTMDEARGLLQIGRDAIIKLTKSGALPTIPFGRSIRIPRQALEAYIAEKIKAS